MPPEVGANARILLDGFNMSDFFREFAIVGEKAVHDNTVFSNNGFRGKQTGVKHGMASGVAFADSTVNTGSWDILKAKYGSGVSGVYVWGPFGLDVGKIIAMMIAEQVTFSPQEVVDDLIRITVANEAIKDSVDMGVSLLPIGAITSFPFTGTAVDNGAATTNGGVGSVHVFDVAGASPNAVYRIQHSSNGSTYVDLITFTGITADNSSQRVEVAGTVNRHLRTTITDNGTTTSANGVVVFARR